MDEQEKYENLYIAINELFLKLGAEGSVSTRDKEADNVMDALYEIDGGVYKQKPPSNR